MSIINNVTCDVHCYKAGVSGRKPTYFVFYKHTLRLN